MTKRKHKREIIRRARTCAFVIVCFAAMLVLVCGCQSSRAFTHRDENDRVAKTAMPASFAFSVAVPEGLAKSGEALEPAWYFLDANGTLRAGVGKRAATMSGDVKPPRIVRNISRQEREWLYRLLQEANVFAVPSVGQTVGDAQDTLVQQAEISSQLQGAAMVGVWWTAGERRRSFVMVPVQSSDGQSDAARVWKGIEQTVTMMRGWMWKSGDAPIVVK